MIKRLGGGSAVQTSLPKNIKSSRGYSLSSSLYFNDEKKQRKFFLSSRKRIVEPEKMVKEAGCKCCNAVDFSFIISHFKPSNSRISMSDSSTRNV
ncbi:hypothetical protein SDJN02_05080, partial [Cucurbita argyrosperma subsp. argyrosperma]